MPIFAKLTIYDGAEEKAKRLKIASQLAAVDAVNYWQNTFTKEHFRATAASKYGYKKRKDKYRKIKKRRKGHVRSLEYTGRSKQVLTNKMRHYQVKQLSKGAVVGRYKTTPQMRYFWMTPKGRPNMAAELTSFVTKEEQMVMHRYQHVLIELMNGKASY